MARTRAPRAGRCVPRGLRDRRGTGAHGGGRSGIRRHRRRCSRPRRAEVTGGSVWRAAWLFGIRRSTCSRHNEPRSAASGPGATTIANRWGCKMRCLECGAEPAQACGRCGASAPVEYQLFVAEDRAADAAYDAASGPASAAVQADVEQQRPESAPDPEADRAELAELVQTQKFSTTLLRPGYDEEEVDAFLDAIQETFSRNTGTVPDTR